MTKQSKIIKILSDRLAFSDCPDERDIEGDWCTDERCDRIGEDSAKCWVRWAAEKARDL